LILVALPAQNRHRKRQLVHARCSCHTLTSMDDLDAARERRRLRDRALDVPNCEQCLHPMEPERSEDQMIWACRNCGSHLLTI